MLDKLINFLIWIKGNEAAKKWIDRIFSLLILSIAGAYIWKALRKVFWQCYYYSGEYYGYYRGYRGSSYWNCESILPGDSFLEVTLGALLLAAIGASIFYGVWKKFRQNEYSILRLLLNTTFPFFVGIVFLSAHIEFGTRAFSQIPWYLYILVGIYTLSPVVQFLRDNFSKEGTCKKILIGVNRTVMALKITFAIYIIVGGALFIVFWIFLGNSWTDFIAFINYSTIVLIFTWMIVTYGWDEVRPIDDAGIRNIRKGAVGLALLIVILWGSPFIKERIIEDRIDKANSILREYGETSEGYKKAANVWGLKWAMKEKYLENRLYQKDLYAKVFDKTLESYIDEELDVNAYRARNSNGTSMLARGENAKVELNFAKHESEIKADVGAVETTVTYEFQNTDTQNQEVIYSIELPTSESVVTDLKLGLNLELTGTLAPRGAAERVYTDSLRRNTDPALLEQTGPTTYRLRVFPVPSKNDSRTQGRQRVAFRYVTPISSGDAISIMPKTDIINLKLTKKSEIVTRVMEGTKALHQDSFKTSDINDLIKGKTLSVKLEGTLKDSLGYCTLNNYEGVNISSLSGTGKNLTKNIVFLDTSKSAGDKKDILRRYQELIDTWKNSGAALDIYTFNTLVTSAGYDLTDIDFWGNTDMAAVISYIKNNGIENANIVILTDDNSYEPSLMEDKTIYYKKLKSNRISLIQIGDNIRTLKTEVTKAILASEGDVYRIGEKSSLDATIKNIFTPKKLPTNCETYSGNNSGVLSALEGNRDGKKIIGEKIYGTGVVKGVIYPTYLYFGYIYTRTNDLMMNGGGQVVISDLNGKSSTLYYNDYNQKWPLSESGLLSVPKSGYYFLDGNSFTGGTSYSSPLHLDKELYMEIDDSTLLEKIGQTAHIINQSMSLIALENDRQRQDLEQYSNQSNKYDTTYQNFDNTQSSPGWNGREMIPVPASNRVMYDASPSETISRRSSSDTLFGATKSASMDIRGGASSFDLNSSSTNLISGASSSEGFRGSIFQYFGILILIPLAIWYFVRRKQTKKMVVEKSEKK